MTSEEAISELTAMVADALEPILGPEELARLVSAAQIPDSQGRLPADSDYVGTYDLNRAAARAFRQKAALVAHKYNVNIEGRDLNRQELIDNFLKMAKEHQKLAKPAFVGVQQAARLSLWQR